MSTVSLTQTQKLELYYWMCLARTFDEMMVAYWKQGKGLGGTFSQRGHEAISVGAGYALAPEDIVAPLHRDLGCYMLRGMTPRRIFSNLLGKETGVSRGRDANLHGMGDLSINILGYISHLPQSLPVAVGVAMNFTYRKEARVSMIFVGDGSSNAGVFHESLNLAAICQAPLVIIIENNQYAYSTPVAEHTKVIDIANKAQNYGIPGEIVDGNDVEAVYASVKVAVDRARSGGGPSLVEAKTMRMMGHAIHDGAEYVPRELLAEWEKKDPLRRYQERLIAANLVDQTELDEIKQRCVVEVTDAIEFAEQSPLPDPSTVGERVYAA